MEEELQFKISSALKDIIGRDLITDDFIAVFELVKNSFDAYADKVDIYFNNINSINSEIIIKDNGKGMNYEDLVNKWLFVAYSAKKEGTEDSNFDYRNIIHSNRPFAGAKGIGRFSCDRLGKFLELESTKLEENPKTEVLLTDWGKFENDIKEEFVDVKVTHSSRSESLYDLEHGTVLKITGLRSKWDRNKLLKLKDSLAKLINPNFGKKDHPFKIFLHVKDELEDDEKFNEYYKKVNGQVQNFIFETLGLKTTKITSSISSKNDFNESFVTTSLYDGGTLIYEIKEKCEYTLLQNIDFTLYYLNKAAKLTFARRMGLASKRYGHIFLYKNGFRIYPFGEPFEDPLKLDVRKSRKIYSHLGTGELIGTIEISGENPEFKETSSRGDGLIKNETYYELEKCFFDILERLEKYVIDVQDWGLSIEDEGDVGDLKSKLTELIEKLTGTAGILSFKAPENLFDIINQSQKNSAEAVIKNLKKIAVDTSNDKLLGLTESVQNRLNKAILERNEAIKLFDKESEKLALAEEELQSKVSENLFLKSVRSQDLNEVISFMHSVGISSSIIDNYLQGLYKKINKGISISPVEMKNAIEVISFENRKILSISRFSTKANFKLYSDEITLDLVNFIEEYINNIVIPLRKENININVFNFCNKEFKRKFKPIEISILIDNFISNSIRAKSTIFNVRIYEISETLMIDFEDDGIGIPEKNRDLIFNFGFTTTSGSGLGLFHSKEIINKMGWEIVLRSDYKKGAKFTLTIN